MFLLALSSCIVAAIIINCETSSSTTTSGLAITPSSAALDAIKVSTVTFTASGGDSNYIWSVGNISMGTLQATGGTALYQSTATAGTNTITVTDTSGDLASATVTQQ